MVSLFLFAANVVIEYEIPIGYQTFLFLRMYVILNGMFINISFVFRFPWTYESKKDPNFASMFNFIPSTINKLEIG
jgi:hypothetical protein